jgi:uncharacterized membrane protein/predicted flap endonuclease-1-like 5' DNA nuclease
VAYLELRRLAEQAAALLLYTTDITAHTNKCKIKGESVMSTRKTLVAILVDDMASARELLDVLRTYHTNNNEFMLLDAVFAEKDEHGNISIHQTADMDTGRGALGGGVVGLLAGGLIFGPVGAVAGTAIGSVLAGVYTSLRDSGMNNRVMMNIARDMEPNQITLILLMEGTLHPAASRLFRNYNTRLFYASLPVGAEDRLREVVEANKVSDTLREMETLRMRDEDLRRAYERDVPVYVVDENDEPVRDYDPTRDTPTVPIPAVPMAPSGTIVPGATPAMAAAIANDETTPDAPAVRSEADPHQSEPTLMRLHSDPLTQITEITQEIEQVLRDNGIKTFHQLSHASTSHLRNLLSQAGIAHPITLPTWNEQAWLAANQRVDELHKLQQEIYAQINS